MEPVQRLDELIDITKMQREAVRDGRLAEVQKLDTRLEASFGAKERAFGAMWQHIKEHGC
jgi:hypothetical protein